jgi:hypothetical protein
MLETLGIDWKEFINKDAMVMHLRIANGDLMDPDDEEKIMKKLLGKKKIERRGGILDTTEK